MFLVYLHSRQRSTSVAKKTHLSSNLLLFELRHHMVSGTVRGRSSAANFFSSAQSLELDASVRE